jgi:hypothetical protein
MAFAFTFPMFVPSLSWQTFGFTIKMAQNKAVFPYRRAVPIHVELAVDDDDARVDVREQTFRKKNALSLFLSAAAFPMFVCPEPVLVKRWHFKHK